MISGPLSIHILHRLFHQARINQRNVRFNKEVFSTAKQNSMVVRYLTVGCCILSSTRRFRCMHLLKMLEKRL